MLRPISTCKERVRFTEAKFTREDYRNSSSFIKTFIYLNTLRSAEEFFAYAGSLLLKQTLCSVGENKTNPEAKAPPPGA